MRVLRSTGMRFGRDFWIARLLDKLGSENGSTIKLARPLDVAIWDADLDDMILVWLVMVVASDWSNQPGQLEFGFNLLQVSQLFKIRIMRQQRRGGCGCRRALTLLRHFAQLPLHGHELVIPPRERCGRRKQHSLLRAHTRPEWHDHHRW